MAICAVGLLAATSGPALAKAKTHKPKKPTINTHTPVARGSTYLALGDAVTFGHEESQVVPAPNYADASSFLGYPELLGSELHLKVVNAACPGETSSSLIDPTAQSNGCENTPGQGSVGYRTLHPLQVSYPASQLDLPWPAGNRQLLLAGLLEPDRQRSSGAHAKGFARRCRD